MNTKALSLTRLLTIAAICLLSGVAARADNWALLIGIDRYDDARINTLGAASADAKALAKTLEEVAGFAPDHVRVLVSDGERKPTRSNIIEELVRLGKNAEPGDTVFVMYSGHGTEIAGTPYLLPYDATAADTDSLIESSLPVAAFRRRLAQIKARALVLAFDMCRTDPRNAGRDAVATDNRLSATLARGLDFRKGDTATPDAPPSATPIAVTLYSCSPNERSYEWADKKRGYFSYFLEQGLRGKAGDASGSVTLLGLAKYVEKQTASAVRREEQKNQTPYPSLEGPGADTFVLVRGEAPPTEILISGKVMDTKARLTVRVNVPNATVSADNTPALNGKFVFNLLDEKQRDVNVKVTAPGYDGQLISVSLERGQTMTLPVTLEPVLTKMPSAETTAILGTEEEADTAVKNGDTRKAIAIYTGRIQAAPKKFALYLKRGIAYYKIESYEQSVADFSTFIRLRPALPEGYLNRAYAYNKLRKREEGLADLAKVEALDKSLVDTRLRSQLLSISSTSAPNPESRADIVMQKVGQQENRTANGLIQVKTNEKNDGRKVSGPSVGALSTKIDPAGFTAKAQARAWQHPRPVITEEMRAAAVRLVRVEFTVGANGSASYKILASSGSKDVDAAVLAACASYKWTAATSGGKPIESKQIVIFDPKQ